MSAQTLASAPTISATHAFFDFAASSVARRPYHLTAEQIRFFDENGYLVIRGGLSPALLERLSASAHRWIQKFDGLSDAERERGAIKQTTMVEHPDFSYATRKSGKRVPFRVNYLHNKGETSSLEVLGSPEILGIAESLAGPNFCPTYESMVFKSPGDGEIIPWHQDAVFPRRHRVFNIDIYLDAAKQDTGALRVIPGSHKQVHDVCPMNDGNYDWANGPHTVVEMQPGDILVHDDMVLHGSPYTANNPLRRVVYFEFRPTEQIIEEGPWDRTWIDQRLRLVPLALKRHQDAFPAQPQFQWNCAPTYRPEVGNDESVELKVVHTLHSPGSYCSANSK
jgi:ectoine hydroxylase-related dioxygenase (phytanoyl-CoA dioxygenase family)